MYRNAGLGAVQIPAGPLGDCTTYMGYYTWPDCWVYTRSAWIEMEQFGTPPEPVSTPATALANSGKSTYSGTTEDEIYSQFNADVTGALKAGQAATNQGLIDFFKNQLSVAPAGGCPGGANPVLQSNGTWTCPSAPLSTWAWIAIAVAGAAGAYLLASAGGRR